MKVTTELELSELSKDLRYYLAKELKDETLLSALANDESARVRVAVAENLDTSKSDLEQLARDVIVDVISAAIQNPNIPKDDLINFFYYAAEVYYPKVYKGSKKTDLGLPKLEKYDAYRVLKSIAVNPKTPKSILAKLSTAADYDIRVDVATNPSTPKTVLERYAEKEESYIREMVANNPNTSPSTLSKLVKDKNEDVRIGVAKNPNTPRPALEKLVRDKERNVREAVATNSNIPQKYLEKLAKDRMCWVQEAAKHRLNALASEKK